VNDSKKSGILVRNVFEGSPAQKAGVKDGDIIVSINNTPVTDWTDYVAIVKQGTPYDMEVLRSGRELLTLHVDTSGAPAEPKTEADYARIIAQIEKATGDKKVFDN